MSSGRPGSDLGRWLSASCSITCEGTLTEKACGLLADHLTLPQARTKARLHARESRHYVTIEYPRHQTVSPPV